MRRYSFPWWLQAFLLIGAIEAIAIGLSGWLAPAGRAFDRLLPPAVSPLNGRVIGGFYLAGAVGLIASLLSRNASDARIFVFGFGFIAGSLLIATFVYWDSFTAEAVPYGWMVTYAIDPLVAILAVVALDLWSPAEPGWHRLSWVYACIAAVLLVSGLVMLLAPSFAVERWPWKLTPELSRVYACLFIGFGLGAALATFESRRPAIRPASIALVSLAGFLTIGSARHLDRFKSTSHEVIWFGIVGLIGIAALYALVELARPASTAGADFSASNPAGER